MTSHFENHFDETIEHSRNLQLATFGTFRLNKVVPSSI